jgi:hypothetical protein
MFALEDGKWMVECDGGCGAVVRTGQKSFQQAINYLSRAEGWDSRKLRDGWRNYCPACSQEADPDPDLAGIGFTRRRIPDEE